MEQIPQFIRKKCKETTDEELKKHSEHIDLIWNNCKKYISGEMEHCARVEKNLEKILFLSGKIDEITDAEYFILSAASCCHDLGKSYEGKSLTIKKMNMANTPQKF